MDKGVNSKGLINNLDKNVEINKVNLHTVKNLEPDDIYVFQVELCDNDIDRVYDKMSDEFLEQVAKSASGLTGLKDHDWSSDNQLSRLYEASVEVDHNKTTQLGEPRKYVLGKAYTLSKYKDYIDKINAGLLKECSISFESDGDTCSICGCPTCKNEESIAVCENGHVAGHVYEGEVCYNNIQNLKDTLEWSLVSVPCQKNAGIKNKSKGEGIMKRTEAFIRQFMSSKAYKEADKEDKETLEKALNDSENDKELSKEDIEKLIDENSSLKEKIKSLEAKVKESEDGRTRDKKESIVSKYIDDLGPLTPKVKEMAMKDVPWDDLDLEDGQIPGLDDVFAGIKEDYKGLFASQSETEERGGHKEPDGDELGTVELNKKGEPDGDEDKLMVLDKKDKDLDEKACGEEKSEKEDEVKSKRYRGNSTFGVSN